MEDNGWLEGGMDIARCHATDLDKMYSSANVQYNFFEDNDNSYMLLQPFHCSIFMSNA
jgi:hypothetical protein